MKAAAASKRMAKAVFILKGKVDCLMRSLKLRSDKRELGDDLRTKTILFIAFSAPRRFCPRHLFSAHDEAYVLNELGWLVVIVI